MTEQERIGLMLDALNEYQQQQALALIDKQSQIAAVMDTIRPQLNAIEAEWADKLDTVGENIAQLQDAVKSAVVALGESVKGAGLQAVYTKPRVIWDNKGLDGYAVAHPEIAALRRVGEPSVSIRARS